MIDHLDHLVITTGHLDKCIDFYTRVLGMKLEEFAGGRLALKFGEQKFNLHVKGREFEPKATFPVPGALDFCLIAAIPLDQVIARLGELGIPIIGSGGLWTKENADAMLSVGALAVQVDAALWNPAFTRFDSASVEKG